MVSCETGPDWKYLFEKDIMPSMSSVAENNHENGKLLNRIKALLQDSFKTRFQGVVLFGSEARGESRPDSDIDILVLLDGPIDWWEDLRTIIDALYDLQLEILRPIRPIPVDITSYLNGKFALYRSARKQGIAA